MPASIPLSTWLLLLPQLAGASQLLPTAIRKMPPDRNAKFHHEYCAFADPDEEQLPAALLARRFSSSNNHHQPQWSNTSTPISPFPPFALLASSSSSGHNDDPPPWFLFRRAKAALERRQWACPVGTQSCASIGFPNSCCGQDETCISIEDTGLGPVGCCPAGATCGGGVHGCVNGGMACASEIGGGCCLEGFVCEGVGCVPYIPPKPTLTTLTTTSTTILSDPTPSTVIITVVTTVTPAPDPITSTTTSTTTVRPTDDTEPGAPLRPTSSAPEPTPTNDNGDNNDDDNDDDDNNNTSRYCPTGFYPCHARAGGGCCPSGRGCDTATCPPVAVTTIVNANGVTVVMPLNEVPAEATPTQGSCAKGWYLCGGDKKNKGEEDEGCCPDGYACGVASCFLTAAGETGGVRKVRPGEGQAASLRGGGWGWWLGVGLAALAGWV
ncbi:hypothetical protein VTJ04DRAFT_9917 [Mycothermus thermophilus]|uniref:uncharacterized protein n=1 Tax=Humicola insolens TaxID=85995 RepID=UPI00374300D6